MKWTRNLTYLQRIANRFNEMLYKISLQIPHKQLLIFCTSAAWQPYCAPEREWTRFSFLYRNEGNSAQIVAPPPQYNRKLSKDMLCFVKTDSPKAKWNLAQFLYSIPI